jgi:hypothetical protein
LSILADEYNRKINNNRGAVDKGSFTEAEIDKNNASNLHFFETGILKE